jgi:RNA polymerase sigma-70 factor (ECF subfamily)
MDLEERSRLFLAHQRSLRAFVRTLVTDPHDAEDLLQEVGVRVLSRDRPAVSAQDFRAWCRGVARNLILHYWRSRHRKRETTTERFADLVAQAYAEAEDLDAEEVWAERRRALADCLGKVGPSARELLSQRYFENLTSEAIAARARLSPVGVRRALMRVREALQRCIEQHVKAAGATS